MLCLLCLSNWEICLEAYLHASGPLASFCVSGNLQHCLYSKSEKMLGSRDLGARVIIQSFPEEPSQVQMKGVQLRDLGQAFRKHLSSLTLVGTMRGKGVQGYDCSFFFLPCSRHKMWGGVYDR